MVGWARAAGFEHVNLDLIYGTPGETDDEFADSLRAAVDSGVDHVSAYSLIVEPGTRLARQVAPGLLPMPDDDVLADRYLLADDAADRGRVLLVRGLQLGPRPTRPGAGTTWPTGPAATGGASARARTRTSAGCAGGTSSTRPPTPQRWPPDVSPAAGPGGARPATQRGPPRTCCCGCGWIDGSPWTALSDDGPARPRQTVAAAGRSAGPGRAGRRDRAVLTLRGRLLADGIALRLID